jgi:hypothetical protein
VFHWSQLCSQFFLVLNRGRENVGLEREYVDNSVDRDRERDVGNGERF